jgi:hypothetical protein
MELKHCDSLRSIHLEGLLVGPPLVSGDGQRRILENVETLLEKIFIKSSVGPRVNVVALTVQVDPYSRSAFSFFGISDVALFRGFEWGKVPEILERGWLGHWGHQKGGIAAGSGDRCQFVHSANAAGSLADKELVLIIQGGSVHGRKRVVEILRGGAFRAFDEKIKFSVQFA